MKMKFANGADVKLTGEQVKELEKNFESFQNLRTKNCRYSARETMLKHLLGLNVEKSFEGRGDGWSIESGKWYHESQNQFDIIWEADWSDDSDSGRNHGYKITNKYEFFSSCLAHSLLFRMEKFPHHSFEQLLSETSQDKAECREMCSFLLNNFNITSVEQFPTKMRQHLQKLNENYSQTFTEMKKRQQEEAQRQQEEEQRQQEEEQRQQEEEQRQKEEIKDRCIIQAVANWIAAGQTFMREKGDYPIAGGIIPSLGRREPFIEYSEETKYTSDQLKTIHSVRCAIFASLTAEQVVKMNYCRNSGDSLIWNASADESGLYKFFADFPKDQILAKVEKIQKRLNIELISEEEALSDFTDDGLHAISGWRHNKEHDLIIENQKISKTEARKQVMAVSADQIMEYLYNLTEEMVKRDKSKTTGAHATPMKQSPSMKSPSPENESITSRVTKRRRITDPNSTNQGSCCTIM